MAIKIKGEVVITDTEDLTIAGSVIAGGEGQIGVDLTVGQDLDVGGNLDVGGSAVIDGSVVIKGDTTIQSRTLNVGYNTVATGASDQIVFYHGIDRVGEIGAKDSQWLRINQDTNKNIYTPRYMRADGGFYIDGVSKGLDGNGNLIGGMSQNYYQAITPVVDTSANNGGFTSFDITGRTLMDIQCYGTNYASNCHYFCTRNTPATTSWKCWGHGEGKTMPNGGTASNGTTYTLALRGSNFRHMARFSNDGNTFGTYEDNNGIFSLTSWMAWRN